MLMGYEAGVKPLFSLIKAGNKYNHQPSVIAKPYDEVEKGRDFFLARALIRPFPGILDALGVAAGTALLRAELPQLEAEAARMRQNLGVDVQQPLVHLIRTLA